MTIPELYEVFRLYPSVQTDSRKLKKGDIFFALKGPNFNGNEFAKRSLDEGASFAVIDEKEFEIPGRTILVNDVLLALQQLANYHRQQFDSPGNVGIPIIAITGSNGKTTTKELIHAVLSTSFKTYTTEGNLNNHIGIPLTILKIQQDAEMAVIEMGANHIGEIASYCKIAMPTYGLITNCGKAHLEGFGSEAGVRKAKGELFDYLRTLPHGHAFVMWDYDYLREMSKGISGIIKYGTTKDAQVTGVAIESSPLLNVSMVQGFDPQMIKTQLVGDYNLPNVLAAIAVGKFFNVVETNIKSAIENYIPSNSRSQLVRLGSNNIILDAYNANPSSMKLAIENFSKQPGEKVLILGSMAELGNDSEKEHATLIRQIEQHQWNSVALVGKEFEKVGRSYLHFKTSLEAKDWFERQHFEHASILIKGSRSMQMEKTIEK